MLAFSADKEDPRVMALMLCPRPRVSPDVMLASIHDDYLLTVTGNLHYVLMCECDREEGSAKSWKIDGNIIGSCVFGFKDRIFICSRTWVHVTNTNCIC